MGVIEKIMGYCFTYTCPMCGETVRFGEEDVCNECKPRVKYVKSPFCVKCGRPLRDEGEVVCRECDKHQRSFNAGICVFEHNDAIKESIYKFKYGNKRDNAKYYGTQAVRLYGRLFKEWGVELIIPIPIHSARLRKRGYNQSELFAKEVSKMVGVPICTNALIRTQNTVALKELSPNMRKINLKNAFAVNKDKLMNVRTVLLVDDILTTGNTLDACSSLLKKVGVKSVYTLCISAGNGV